MPRDVPAGLLVSIQSEAFQPAVLLLVTRRDGVKLGFTDSDETVTFSGDDYEPSEGLKASAISSSAGSGVDNLDVGGALQSARITETDISAGLYDGARVAVRLVDRTNVALGAAVLLTGVIGEIKVKNGSFYAQVRSLSSLLKQSVGDMTSKTCRVKRLGDARCKVDMDGNTAGGTPIRANKALDSGSGLNLTFASDSAPTGYYTYGVVTFTSGPNSGISREVKSHTLSSGKAVLVLRTAFPFAVTSGQTAQLEAGCDRVFATCRDKFANANNFHGEHLLPGNDKVSKALRQS